MVDGPGFGLDELVEAQAVGFPFADVVGVLVAEHQRRVSHHRGHFVQLVTRLVAVQLQELQDVVAEHLLDTHLRLGVGNGAEKQVQTALGGKDGALADEADGGDLGIDVLAVDGVTLVVEGHGGLAADGGHGRTGGLLGAAALTGGEKTGSRNQREENAGCFFHRKNYYFCSNNEQS